MKKMEMLSRSHTPLLSNAYINFHSRTNRFKYRPSFIVSASRTNGEGLERRITRKRRKQESIPMRVNLKAPFLEKIFNILDSAITEFLDPPLHFSVDPAKILLGNCAPVDEKIPTECKVVYGTIPSCLSGVYLRNGPNPQFPPNGPHHYLDGDGMVHCIRISHGRATFCSRYVKTNKYVFENQVGSHAVPNVIGGMHGLGPFIARATLFAARVLFSGYDIGKGIGVANTSLALLGGKLYALCESDIPYAIKIKDDGDIITLGHHDFNGSLSMNMTAHPKIDPATKEAFAFRYWTTRPYLTYFRFDAEGNKQPDVPINSMKHPSLTHDLAITQKYAIICDIQVRACPMNLVRGEPLVGVDPNKVPRIGVLPRYAADESNMKWFEVPGFNIFHAVNAWDETDEEGGEVVVLVAPNIVSVEHFFERAVGQIHGSMEKVRVHLGTGVVSRHIMSTKNLEFPVINPAYIGKKNKYVYAAIFSDQTPSETRMMRASGVVKLDVTALEEEHEGQNECTMASRMYEDNCFGGEPFFIERDPENLRSEEDDGYVVSYVHDESSGESRFLVMDARSPTLEVVAAVKLPQRVPYGLHGIFIRENDLYNL
ncbi:putative oxidoreductase [Helianthus annuus]|nr:putative oxidoreductase [Helianthus annuus]